ncbi:MAG: ABC transporter ATP-binding protein/permease [Acidimicrobiales bacterium]|nr:ABC transporter ATP-binding protein/permease [Acidimicrobiales bacterium]
MRLRHLYRVFRPWRLYIASSIALEAIASFSEAAALIAIGPLAQLTANGADHFTGSLGPIHLDVSASTLVLVAALCVIASFALQTVSAYVASRTTASFERAARMEVYDSYLQASLAKQLADREGRLQTRFGGFVNQSAQTMGSLTSLARSGISMLVLFAGALVINPLFAGVMLAFASALTLLMRPLNNYSRRLTREAAAVQVKAAEQVAETTANIREVRIFHAIEPLRRETQRLVDVLTNLRKRQSFVGSIVSPTYQSLGLLLVIAMLGFASTMDGIDLAALGAVALMLLRSVSYGQQLQSTLQRLTTSTPYVEMLADAVNGFRASREPTGARSLDSIENVAFHHVSFTYPANTDRSGLDSSGQTALALNDVTLSFSTGEIVGIAGPSGSGKSTLAQLLLGLRRPTEGQVTVNGIPISELDPRAWARHVAFVPQETRLLHTTARENIRFFRDWITDREVEEAAARAGIAEVIKALPDGFDTEVGAATRSLSGGQLQRLSIARALAGNPSVVVLDEPTSALDAHSELLIRDAIERLDDHVLRIVIAHRLTTLAICDRLVVIRNGRIEADGPAEDVLRDDPFLRDAIERGYLDIEPDRFPASQTELPQPAEKPVSSQART